MTRTGDKVLFIGNADGSATMRNATMQAMRDLQGASEGAAEEAGLKDEDDVAAMIREMSAEKRAAR